jgi:hypothetical protein
MDEFNLIKPKNIDIPIPQSLKKFENEHLFHLVYFSIYQNKDVDIQNDIEIYLVNFFKKNRKSEFTWVEHWEGHSLIYVDEFFSKLFKKFKINKKITFISGNILKSDKFNFNQLFSLQTMPVGLQYPYVVNYDIKPKYKFFIQGGRVKKERSYILDLFKAYEIDENTYNHTISLLSNLNEGRDKNNNLKYSFQRMSDLISESYFQIVCETTHPMNSNYWIGDFVQPPTMCFTEKIGYALYHKKPFLMINLPYSLYNLKQLGFKTFSNVWSEDYDNLTNIKDRINTIFDIVLWLDTLNEPQLNKILRKTNESVNHNYDLILKMYNNKEMFGKMEFENFNFKNPWLNLT